MKVIRGFNLLVSMILLLCAVGTCCAEIRLLMSVFRHGERYPVTHQITNLYYPRNPHANINWYPNSAGDLTDKGKRRSFRLGNLLRKRYGEWLGSTYSRKLVDFTSSTPDRTIIATAIVAAALFSPINSQRWNPKLNWQPIPVSRVRLKDNILFLSSAICTNYYTNYLIMRINDRTIIEYDRNMREFYTHVSHHTGAPVTNKVLFNLYMEFVALVNSGLEPPKWADSIFRHGNLTEAAIMEFIFSSWNDDLKRLTGGVWLKEWLDHVDAYLMLDNETSIGSSKTNDSTKKKAFFYGGHDVNIVGIMITLDIYYRHIPNYSSAINFELHEDDNHHFYVKVLHRNSGEFTEYLVPGCDNILCPLDTFKNIFANVIPQNLFKECGPRMSKIW